MFLPFVQHRFKKPCCQTCFVKHPAGRGSSVATLCVVRAVRSTYTNNHPPLLIVLRACGSLQASGCHGFCIPRRSFLTAISQENKKPRHPLCSAPKNPRKLVVFVLLQRSPVVLPTSSSPMSGLPPLLHSQ